MWMICGYRLLDRAADTIYDDDVLKYAIEDFADETYDDDADMKNF